jgi:predicted cupin superfamily sugar epimerase
MTDARDPEVSRMIDALGLAPHPEGGFYRETFRSTSTAIYFLLPAGEFSAFHRLRASDEIWHFADFELPTRDELLTAFPRHESVIRQRTRR